MLSLCLSEELLNSLSVLCEVASISLDLAFKLLLDSFLVVVDSLAYLLLNGIKLVEDLILDFIQMFAKLIYELILVIEDTDQVYWGSRLDLDCLFAFSLLVGLIEEVLEGD